MKKYPKASFVYASPGKIGFHNSPTITYMNFCRKMCNDINTHWSLPLHKKCSFVLGGVQNKSGG